MKFSNHIKVEGLEAYETVTEVMATPIDWILVLPYPYR
jgi:hypothetical protein